jgi:hypothetical protein
MNHNLINILNLDQRRALENVRAAAERIWARPLHRYYTDHTPQGHSTRVIALLDGLTAGMMATNQRLALGEAFVLLAAAYLHDIGMQNEKFAGGDLDDIRGAHHEQTAEMIYAVFEDPASAFSIPLVGDPTVAEAVALVAKGHRRVDLSAAEYDPLVYGEETLRLRLLAALLRFGDELDIDQRRVDMEQLKLLALPEESLLHWWKCHYVSGVSIQDEYIHIAYRFPQERPDYEGLIVPLVEGDVRTRHAELEEIFRANAVKVALGKSQVRLMRLVQPLPPEVEDLAKEKMKDKDAAMPQALTQAPPQGLATGIKQVQLIIERDFNTFEPSHQQELINALAALLKVESRSIRVLHVQAGSVMITLEMSAIASNRLEGLARQHDFRLWNLGITSIRFEGGITIELSTQVADSGKPMLQRTLKQRLSSPEPAAIVSDEDLSSLQRQLAQERQNLRLIQERKAEFVLSVEVPLQLVKEERRLLDKIAGLEQQIAARSGRGLPAGEEAAPSTLFDQRGQTVGTQINVAGDYVEQRPASGATYHIHIDRASGLAIGDGARAVQGGQPPSASAKPDNADIRPVAQPAEAAPPDDFRYDTFISYSHQDADWVRQTLLPRLERAGLRACIDFRDFEIGAPSLVNMENAVERSRKTLLVLTPAWVTSEWTAFEALLIQTKDPAGRARRILPLLVKRCQLPGRLGIFTYLDLTAPDEAALAASAPAPAAENSQRCADLAEHIRETLELIKQYEDKRRLADDPKAKRRTEREIEDLRRQLAGYQAEARELGCE